MSALNSFKILELAVTPCGEYTGKLISDFGADIIKIEPPEGSPTRGLGPFVDDVPHKEKSGLFAFLNTNKQSVTLDLESDAGKATLLKLLDHVDVVIDDHKPGWLKSIGIDPETFQAKWPKLVVCSISDFGQETSEERQNSTDLSVFHASGWGYHTPTNADPALPPLSGAGRFQVSLDAAIDAASCIASCLFERGTSGKGQFIDLSKQAVMASRVDYVLAPMVAGEMNTGEERAAFDLAGPASILPCRDGYIYIWLSAPMHWQGLAKLLDDTDWMKEFPDNWLERGVTPERVAKTREEITKWLAGVDKEDAAARAQELGITLVAVNAPSDLLEHPQYVHREFFKEIAHPEMGAFKYPTVPYKLSETPAEITSPAPKLGAHTDAKLAELTGEG